MTVDLLMQVGTIIYAEDLGYRNLLLISIHRDLNPLHDVISRGDYKERYYKSLMPLGLKYSDVSALLSTWILNKFRSCKILSFLFIASPFKDLSHN